MITIVTVQNKISFTLDTTKKLWFRNDMAQVKWPMPEMPVIATGSPLVLPLANNELTRTTNVVSHNQVG
jgi:hypothetical protein